jgi:hypothetical protein
MFSTESRMIENKKKEAGINTANTTHGSTVDLKTHRAVVFAAILKDFNCICSDSRAGILAYRLAATHYAITNEILILSIVSVLSKKKAGFIPASQCFSGSKKLVQLRPPWLWIAPSL